MGRERVPMSSKTLSWDKRCTCCATEHPRMSDFALFVCSSFIVTHCNSHYYTEVKCNQCISRFLCYEWRGILCCVHDLYDVQLAD